MTFKKDIRRPYLCLLMLSQVVWFDKTMYVWIVHIDPAINKNITSMISTRSSRTLWLSQSFEDPELLYPVLYFKEYYIISILRNNSWEGYQAAVSSTVKWHLRNPFQTFHLSLILITSEQWFPTLLPQRTASTQIFSENLFFSKAKDIEKKSYLRWNIYTPWNEQSFKCEKYPEPLVIFFSNTIGDPRTVMVELSNAVLAFPTVSRSQRSLRQIIISRKLIIPESIWRMSQQKYFFE